MSSIIRRIERRLMKKIADLPPDRVDCTYPLHIPRKHVPQARGADWAARLNRENERAVRAYEANLRKETV